MLSHRKVHDKRKLPTAVKTCSCFAPFPELQVLTKAVAADQKRDAAGSAREQQAVCLLEADRELFLQLYLVPSCAGDHIPDAYYAALTRLHESLLARLLPAQPAATAL
jgi:hypothetical protein